MYAKTQLVCSVASLEIVDIAHHRPTCFPTNLQVPSSPVRILKSGLPMPIVCPGEVFSLSRILCCFSHSIFQFCHPLFQQSAHSVMLYILQEICSNDLPFNPHDTSLALSAWNHVELILDLFYWTQFTRIIFGLLKLCSFSRYCYFIQKTHIPLSAIQEGMDLSLKSLP